MNTKLFYQAIHNEVAKVASLLGLTVRDAFACIYDDGFTLPDWRKIQKAYNLTDSQILEIQLTEDNN